MNEIELLILVTPEFADGMEPHEVPPCGPGMETVSPTNRQLYFGGHLEVPSCGICAPGCGPGNCGSEAGGCQNGSCNTSMDNTTVISDGSYPSSNGVPYGGSMQSDSVPPTIADPQEQVPLSEPELPGVTPSDSLPDPSAGSSPWLRNQMPAQYSRENPAYKNLTQRPVNTTTTPGLIGPLGYDTEN